MTRSCAAAVRERETMTCTFPVGCGRRGAFNAPVILSDFGLIIIQLFLVLSSIAGNDLPLSTRSSSSTSANELDEEPRRTSGFGIALAEGYAMTGAVAFRSRLMPRYECCCQDCPRRPCFICRNVDYACNCASCSCYADANPLEATATTPHGGQQNSAEEEDAPVMNSHRVRHQRYRNPSQHHRGHGHKMSIDLGVTSVQGNAFIDRLLQRHPASISSSKTPTERERT